MPAWREYGAVDLYLILGCTTWAKQNVRQMTYVVTVTVPVTDWALCSTQTVPLQVLCHY